jgi:outer membrane protein assembly factor BamB
MVVVLLALSASSLAQVSVVTQHNDNARTGQNLSETDLTPSVVNTKHFGELFAQSVDAMVVGQPLYLPNLQINGGTHNVVFVTTLNNSVYAFDADSNTGSNASPLWFQNFGTPVPIAEQGCSFIGFATVGIVGTPVIDPGTGMMYLVAKTKENGNYVHRLHALDVTTGQEKAGGPVVIQASYNSNGNQVTFTDQHHMQRAALLLSDGVLYIPFGTAGCKGYPPSTGWMMAYNANNLQQLAVLDIGPTQDALPGIWMSGFGPAADKSGDVYVATGDGLFNYDVGGLDMGDTLLRLRLGGGVFGVADYFTPYNQADLYTRDLDLGSSGLVVLPHQPGPYPNLALIAGKQGMIYLVNRDNLGQYNPIADMVVQEVPFDPSLEVPIFGGATYWNNFVYFGSRHFPIESFSLTNGMLSTTPVAKTAASYSTASQFSISAHGKHAGILWGVERVPNVNSILDAFQATNLKLLYSSSENPTRDPLHVASHYVLPTIANGKVYVGTTDNLVVMGLLSKIKPIAGNNQTGLVSTTLPKALKVKVKNIYTGQPMAGVTITFSDGGAGGSFSHPTAVTNDDGVAGTKYTLPAEEGVYQITASNLTFITGHFTETATGARAAH